MGNSMDRVLPGLYVGNIRGASSKTLLDKNGITHVLAIFDKAQPIHEDRVYLCIKANDVAGQNLTQYFSQCNDFIHNARINKGTVLVHCVAGMSRSVTITTAYIMTITGLGWREALNAVRGARRSANPNFGFQRQLLAFFHDHLYEEKTRFEKCFPPAPFDDKAECERLIEIHRKWVLHGDEGADDSETTYPLQHNAYKTEDDTHAPTNTSRGSASTSHAGSSKAEAGPSTSGKIDVTGTMSHSTDAKNSNSTNPAMQTTESRTQSASKTLDASSAETTNNDRVLKTGTSSENPNETLLGVHLDRKRGAGSINIDEPKASAIKLEHSSNTIETPIDQNSHTTSVRQGSSQSMDKKPANDSNGSVKDKIISEDTSKKQEDSPDVYIPDKSVSKSAHDDQSPCCSGARNDDIDTTNSDVDQLIDSIFTEKTKPKERSVCFNEKVEISKVEKIDSQMKENAQEIKNVSTTGRHESGKDHDSNAIVDDMFKSS